MNCQIRYGADSCLQLQLPAEVEVADCSRPRVTPLDDPAAAVAAALTDPLGFPPLAQATVPGDRVVLALDDGVPLADRILAGVVHVLLSGTAKPSDICLVRASSQPNSPSPLASLAPEIAAAIEVQTHDPANSAGLAYLAATKRGTAIYLNRTICDADVVIPIGAFRLDASPGYLGVHGGLFPTFSDEETQQRFRAPSTLDWRVHQQRRRAEAAEAAWLLGAQFTLQVVPGPGESVLHVLAGDAEAVAGRGSQLCQAAWMFEVPRRASLVVAAIEGGPDQQTWDNFARAVFAASQAAHEDGAIVVCTQLQSEPGPALKRLATVATASENTVDRELRRDRTPDVTAASLLAKACQRSRVYLLSRLRGEVVEELGMAHVEKAQDIQRLCQQFDSCILLCNAQHAMVRSLEDG